LGQEVLQLKHFAMAVQNLSIFLLLLFLSVELHGCFKVDFDFQSDEILDPCLDECLRIRINFVLDLQ